MYKGMPVVALCGPQEARADYLAAEHALSCNGNIVIGTVFFGQIDANIGPEEQKMLEMTRRKKIDMADELFVVNTGGVLDDDTRRCIEYAKSLHIVVRYLAAWDKQLNVPKKAGEEEAPYMETRDVSIRVQEIRPQENITKVKQAMRVRKKEEN